MQAGTERARMQQQQHQDGRRRRRPHGRITPLTCLTLLLALSHLTVTRALELTLQTTGLEGQYTLRDDRSPTGWGWTGSAATADYAVGLVANGVSFSPQSVTPAPALSAVASFDDLPPTIQTYIAQAGFNATEHDAVSVLSTNMTSREPYLWVFKSHLNRPAVVFLSQLLRCDSVVFSAHSSTITCRSVVPVVNPTAGGGAYTWTAVLISNLTNGGHTNSADGATSTVTISITTNSTVPGAAVPTKGDGVVEQLLAIAYTKCSESVRLNADIISIHSQDDSRRRAARVAVAFLWLFITITCSFAVFVVSVWLPWAIPYTKDRLLNIYSIGATFSILAGIFVALGLTQGLSGFVILVVMVLFTISIINLVYCCLRARNRTSSKITPVTDSLSGNAAASLHGEDVGPGGEKYLQSGEEESLVPVGSTSVEGTSSSSSTVSELPAYTRYPAPLGTKQRSFISVGAMSFLIGSVTCVAIFGLWDCEQYLLWDRQSAGPVSEYMPQAIAKATLLVYAYDGFADRIQMNHIFFDVSTQWCGSHYSTRLSTTAQKYTSIYRAFIDKYAIDMTMYAPSDYLNYTSVNQWFIRDLAPDVRPISAQKDTAVITQPCDARIMVFHRIPTDSQVWIKDGAYTVETLIGSTVYRANVDAQGVSKYTDGSMALVRLAPQDYHQFHAPVDGIVKTILRIEGGFHSVNADGMTSGNYAIYNQRTVVVIDTAGFADIGEVAYVAIGALCVGSITITAPVGERIYKGHSIGYFQFGGSTIAVVFEKGRIKFDDDILQHSTERIETLVQMGTTLATKL